MALGNNLYIIVMEGLWHLRVRGSWIEFWYKVGSWQVKSGNRLEKINETAEGTLAQVYDY